jgi:DNA-binding MarR family transcriptional regulator
MTDESNTIERLAGWGFLTNHAHVLLLLAQDPDILVRQIAGWLELSERGVQKILSQLEEAGYISRHRHGRQYRYEVHKRSPLQHPRERHRTVKDLLTLG